MKNREELWNRAEQWLDAHKDELIRDLSDFVNRRSVSRSDLAAPGAPFGEENAEMLKFALKRVSEYGFSVKNGNGYYGTAHAGDDGNAIGLIAHLDVVPEGVNWIYPPYQATLQGDFLFGRGSGDNKGSAMAALYVMRMIRDLNLPLRHGLRLILGVSEETGMQDMDEYLKNETPCKVTLVPDAAFPVCYAQKGSLTLHLSILKGDGMAYFRGGEVDNMVPPLAECALPLPAETVKKAFEKRGFTAPDYEILPDGAAVRVIAHGASAHAAGPEAGKSAVYMLSKALAETGLLGGESLSAMEAVSRLTGCIYGESLNICAEDADTGRTTAVVGIAKTEKNRIVVHVDSRLSAAAESGRAKAAACESAGKLGFTVDFAEATNPVYMPKDDPRVQALQSVYAECTGDAKAPYAMGGGTYSRRVPDAITFGLSFPGPKPRPEGLPEGHGSAHAPDEYVHIPSLLKAAKIYLFSVLALDEIV